MLSWIIHQSILSFFFFFIQHSHSHGLICEWFNLIRLKHMIKRLEAIVFEVITVVKWRHRERFEKFKCILPRSEHTSRHCIRRSWGIWYCNGNVTASHQWHRQLSISHDQYRDKLTKKGGVYWESNQSVRVQRQLWFCPRPVAANDSALQWQRGILGCSVRYSPGAYRHNKISRLTGS